MKIGLDDVIAAETRLSHVDGAAGRLVIKGHDLEELAGRTSFEAAMTILWADIVPSPPEGMAAAIAAGRLQSYERFAPFFPALSNLAPIEGLRFLLASIGDDDPLAEPSALSGATAVAAALAIRAASGANAIAPSPDFSHAADFLRMVENRTPDPQQAAAFDAYLVTVIDHGLNASTFAARVVASTRAGRVSAVTAALGALKGPLHGGAPGPVLDMLDAIAESGDARGWLMNAIKRGERLMGFGHRIYRTRDPRADVLKSALSRLGNRSERLVLAETVERQALDVLSEHKAGRRLDVNVEFYTALLLESVGLPRAGFTPAFAVGRVAGWLAHAAEQEMSGRLIRPQSHYVGPMPGANQELQYRTDTSRRAQSADA